MDATDKFMKFAAECEQMARRASGRADKSTWRELAQRWQRCAELRQSQGTALHDSRLARRHQQPAPG